MQYGSISKQLCWLKKFRQKEHKIHDLYKTLENENEFIVAENRLVVAGEGC